MCRQRMCNTFVVTDEGRSRSLLTFCETTDISYQFAKLLEFFP